MIGFFGGSFDPVHYGHLKNAMAIKKELNLNKVFLMPCKEPVHKNKFYFSKKQRLDMLNLALKEFKGLLLDTQEFDRETPSWTIDSLISIKKKYPKTQIYLIIGTDSFINLHTWKDYKLFEKYAKIVVLPRSNYTKNKTFDKNIYFAKTPLVDISSSEIRSKITNQQNLSGLLPNSIIDYIYAIK